MTAAPPQPAHPAPSNAAPAARNTQAERAWLLSAAGAAGAQHYATHALRRLTAGQATYGDRWTSLGLDRLVLELLEEAADLGAWGVLALQALDADPALSEAVGPAIATRLHEAITAGARAHRELELAQSHLERRQAADGSRT